MIFLIDHNIEGQALMTNKNYSRLIDELFDAIEENPAPKKIREVIEAGVDVNVRVEEDCTPLIAAVIIGNFDLVKLLVELGADANLWDKYGDPALFYAKYCKLQEIAEYLEPITSPEVRSDVEQQIEYLKRTSKHFGE